MCRNRYETSYYNLWWHFPNNHGLQHQDLLYHLNFHHRQSHFRLLLRLHQSCISYLLSRYIKIYPNKYCVFNKLYDICIYLFTAFLTAFFSMLLVGIAGKNGWALYTYLSPLVILGSVYLLLFFTKLSFYSKSINWTASSAFAVYLLHCDPLLFEPYFLSSIRKWYIDCSVSVFLFYSSMLIISVFCLAIFVDKIRLLLWEQAYSVYYYLINKDKCHDSD